VFSRLLRVPHTQVMSRRFTTLAFLVPSMCCIGRLGGASIRRQASLSFWQQYAAQTAAQQDRQQMEFE
jgi:hypothetical protein